MSSSAREEMLARIRSALGGSAAAGAAQIGREYSTIPHDYAQEAEFSPEHIIDLLEERLRDYDAEVTRVDESEVARTVASILTEQGGPGVLVPADFPATWRPKSDILTEDAGFDPAELDRFQRVVTTATLAIADTGTFVLQTTPGQGRRAISLVPDFHLCVVRVSDVVQTVPEAFARLRATATLPTTFVSGPSATADIEMTRIKGVHGPRSLHVLLVSTHAPNAPAATPISKEALRTPDEQH